MNTNTTTGKSKELNIDLKEIIIDLNMWGKSLGAISKQLQDQRSTVQTTFKYRVHGTVVSPLWSGRKHKITRCWEKIDQDGRESTKNTKKQVCNELEAAGRQLSVSTVSNPIHTAIWMRGSCANSPPLCESLGGGERWNLFHSGADPPLEFVSETQYWRNEPVWIYKPASPIQMYPKAAWQDQTKVMK